MSGRKGLAVVISVALALLAAAFFWLRASTGPHDDESSSSAAALRSAPLRTPTTVPDLRRAKTATIRGTVRNDETGRGIGGARVCARYDVQRTRGSESRFPTCAKTKLDGGYELRGLMPTRVFISGTAPGYLPAAYEVEDERGQPVRHLELAAAQQVEDVSISLAPGGVEVKGIVEDLTGGPVSEAWVSVHAGGWFGRGSSAWAVTGDEGEFSVWVAAGRIQAQALADGYASASKSGVAPGRFMKLLLTPETVVVGKVVRAADKSPVEGAYVTAGSGWFSASDGARTDAEGTFRIPALSPGHFEVTATGDDLYGEAFGKVPLGLGQTSEPIVVEVHPAFMIAGRIVIPEEDGRVCDSGSVSFRDVKLERRARANPEADGQVVARGVRPGTYAVTVTCRGYVVEPEYPEVVVTDASVRDLRWQVHTGHVLRGEVLDAAGQPVKGATVLASPKDAKASTRGRQWSTPTGADGRFEQGGLVPGAYKTQAWGADGRPGPTEDVEFEVPDASDPDPITITMPGTGAIEGHVRDENGEPVAGANVRSQFAGEGRGSSASTTDGGSFRIAYARVGQHRVTASMGWRDTMRAPGTSDDDQQGQMVEVAASQVSTVDFVVESRSGTIRGSVETIDGAPVADAFITTQRVSDSAASGAGSAGRQSRWGSWGDDPVLTDHDGTFIVTGLSPGNYAVRGYRKGGGEAVADSVEVGGEVALVLADTGSVSGSVVVPGGKPPMKFDVSLSDVQSGLWRNDDFYRTEGKFTFAELPAGTFKIKVTSIDGDAEIADVPLAEGEHKTGVTVELEPRIELTGRVVDLDSGEPVKEMRVTASRGTGGGMSFMMDQADPDKPNVSKADGRFRIESAPVGEITLSVMPLTMFLDRDAKYSWSSMPITVPADAGIYDVGDLEIVSKRVEADGKAGELGLKLKEREPDTKSADSHNDVAFVRPGGPAASAGVKVGDRILKVDGHDVDGDQHHRYRSLVRVPEGTALTMEMGDGRSVKVVTGPPLGG